VKVLGAEAEINRLMLQREQILRRIRAEEGDQRGVESAAHSADRLAEVKAIFEGVRQEAFAAAEGIREADRALDELRAGIVGESPLWPEGKVGTDQAAAVRAARESRERTAAIVEDMLSGAEARRDLAAAYEEMLVGIAGESARVAGEESVKVYVRAVREHAATQADLIRGAGFGEGFQGGMEQMKSQVRTIGELGASSANLFADSFSRAFADFATGTKSASEAVKAFAIIFVQETIRMIAAQLVLKAITTALGAPVSPSISAQQSADLSGFTPGLGGVSDANFRSFTVGGYGGADSQLRSNAAKSGEMGSGASHGKSATGGARVTVNIHNNAPGTAVRAERHTGSRGDEIRVFIEEVVAGSVNGGKVGRAIGTVFGASPRPRVG